MTSLPRAGLTAWHRYPVQSRWLAENVLNRTSILLSNRIQSFIQWFSNCLNGDFLPFVFDCLFEVLQSGVFCHRNCCVTFARCDGALSCMSWKSLPNDIQAVRKSSTDQCNSSGQLFSVDQWKRHQFFHSKNDVYHQPFWESGTRMVQSLWWKGHFLIN